MKVWHAQVIAGDMLYVPPGFVWCEFNTEHVIGVKIPAVDVSHLETFELMKRDFSLMKLGEIPNSLQATIEVLTAWKPAMPKSESDTAAAADSSASKGAGAAGAAVTAGEAGVQPDQTSTGVAVMAGEAQVQPDQTSTGVAATAEKVEVEPVQNSSVPEWTHELEGEHYTRFNNVGLRIPCP